MCKSKRWFQGFVFPWALFRIAQAANTLYLFPCEVSAAFYTEKMSKTLGKHTQCLFLGYADLLQWTAVQCLLQYLPNSTYIKNSSYSRQTHTKWKIEDNLHPVHVSHFINTQILPSHPPRWHLNAVYAPVAVLEPSGLQDRWGRMEKYPWGLDGQVKLPRLEYFASYCTSCAQNTTPPHWFQQHWWMPDVCPESQIRHEENEKQLIIRHFAVPH